MTLKGNLCSVVRRNCTLSRSKKSGAIWLCYGNFVNLVKGMASVGFQTFHYYLNVAWRSLTFLSCGYNFFRLISEVQITIVLSSLIIGSGGAKFEIFHEYVAYFHSIL